MTKKEIEGDLQTGDVILIEGTHKWYQIGTAFIHAMIRWYQRRLFGRKANTRDIHATLYIDPEHVFSTTYPRARWETLGYQLERKFTVYRYSGGYTETDKMRMRAYASQIRAQWYDVGDLLDFLISGLLGYTETRKIRFFELSRRHMVCSTAVRAILERTRQAAELTGDYSKKRLFNKLNPAKWPKRKLKKFTRTDVEMTTPAHFANSDYFEYEFIKIISWEDYNKEEAK